MQGSIYLGCLPGGLTSTLTVDMRKHPDIILLVLDTQRLDRLSCYGYGGDVTPHLDTFAGRATLFQRAVATAQWTVPTHASMFTGLYPSQHTMHQMESVLPTAVVTLAERLKQAGYFTAGYSHNPLVGAIPNGLERGFIDFKNYHSLAAGLLAFQFEQQRRAGNVSGRIRHAGRFLLAEVSGYSHRSALRNLSVIGEPLWRMFLKLRRQSKAALVTNSLREAAHLLLERPGLQPDQPVFVFINLMGVHVPYDPPSWAVRRFLPGRLGAQEARRLLQQANSWQADVCNWLNFSALSEGNVALLNAFYDAEVAEQDAKIGSFLDQLQKGGVIDQSMVIVTADHGDHLGDKQRLNHAFGVYNALVHVPLIIHDPQGELPQNGINKRFISTRRIYHTILTAAGIADADEAKLSLANQVDDDTVIAEGFPLMWAMERLERYRPGVVQASGYARLVRAVYSGDYKFIAGEHGHELYHLPNDALEAFDLSQKEPARVQALQKEMSLLAAQLQPVTHELVQQTIDDETILAQLRSLGYIE